MLTATRTANRMAAHRFLSVAKSFLHSKMSSINSNCKRKRQKEEVDERAAMFSEDDDASCQTSLSPLVANFLAEAVPVNPETSSHGNKRLKSTNTDSCSSSSCSFVDDLVCPITIELPHDPVTAEDGRIYERQAIEHHFRLCRQSSKSRAIKSPITNQYMGCRLFPAIQTRNLIQSLIHKNLIQDQDLVTSWKYRQQQEEQNPATITEQGCYEIHRFNNITFTKHLKNIQKYREQESQLKPPLDFPNDIWALQNSVTEEMRLIMLDWLIKLDYNIRFPPSTLQLAVSILDQYLSTRLISTSKFQLLGLTCFWIASKHTIGNAIANGNTFRDIVLIDLDLDDLVYFCDKAYTKTQFLKMEKKINAILKDLHPPNLERSQIPQDDSTFIAPLLFAIQHQTTSENIETIDYLTRYILDGCFLSCHLLHGSNYRRSDLITASFYIAYCSICGCRTNQSSGRTVCPFIHTPPPKIKTWWNLILQKFTTYKSIQDIIPIAKDILSERTRLEKSSNKLLKLYKASEGHGLLALDEKYSRKQCCEVASIPLIRILEEDNGTDNRGSNGGVSSCIIS